MRKRTVGIFDDEVDMTSKCLLSHNRTLQHSNVFRESVNRVIGFDSLDDDTQHQLPIVARPDSLVIVPFQCSKVKYSSIKTVPGARGKVSVVAKCFEILESRLA